MDTNDPKLGAVLKQWRDIEPSASFEADVRRRIRLAESEQSDQITWAAAWHRLLWRPALAAATAIIVSALVSLVAIKPTPAPAELGFLSAGTLSGGYLRLVEERTR